MNLLYYIISLFMITSISGCFNKHLHEVKVSHVEDIVVDGLSSKFKNKNEEVLVNSCRKILSSNTSNFINKSNHKYQYANKGSYSSYCYTVKPGDTLFYIAWITGNDYHILAERNGINVQDVLKVGQILRVGCDEKVFGGKFSKINDTRKENTKKKINCSLCAKSKTFKLKDTVSTSGRNGITKKVSCIINKNFTNSLPMFQKDIFTMCNSHKVNLDRNTISSPTLVVEKKLSVSWDWPTVNGKIINRFSLSEGGNKGIDISGVLGQPVLAAGQGKVVYAGDALLGYGNLIIIKHNDDFLSTYAHNDKILVVEQQSVKIGQKIATMGSSGSDIVKLHFEIRHKGRSVDPLYYLPKK